MTAQAAHPPTAHQPEGYEELQRYGLWLFIISEAFLFAVLIVIRFVFLGLERPESVSIGLGLVLTAILVSSSVTLHRGEKAAEAGDQAGLRRGILLTIALGVLFLVIVGFEWSTGFGEFPTSTPYGSVFFFITGAHALHLLSGLLVLGSLYIQSRRGAITESSKWKIEGCARYWHFVDVIWLSVFTTLYLL